MRISHINQYFDKVLTTKIENPIPFETVHLSTFYIFLFLSLFMCSIELFFFTTLCTMQFFPDELFRLKAEIECQIELCQLQNG